MPTEMEIRIDLAKQLRGNYAAGWDADRDALCKRVLTDVYREVGADRLVMAVKDCTKYEQFFTEQNLRKHIPETSNKKRRQTCKRCDYTGGFIYVLVDGEVNPRCVLCKHDPPVPTIRIRINPLDPRWVTARVCDWIDQQ